MTKLDIIKKFTICIIWFLGIITTTFSIAGAPPLDGEWKLHPSFFRQVEKVIDSERFTYYLLQQQRFSTTFPDCSNNYATLFWNDKAAPEGEITSLSATYPQIPVIIRTVTYSVKWKSLVILADNGEIWIKPDSRNPFPIYGLDNISRPGDNRIYSLTEDSSDGKIWIAGAFGFAVVDPEKRKVEEICYTQSKLKSICKAGNNIIAISDTGICTSELPSGSEVKMSDLPLIAVDENGNETGEAEIKEPSNLMPLSEHTFAFLSKAADGSNNYTLNVATLKNGKCYLLSLLTDQITVNAASETPLFPTAINCTPNKDGYLIFGSKNIYQLKRGHDFDPAQTSVAESYRQRAIEHLTTSNDRINPLASWDLTTFTFYRIFDGFYRRNYENQAWTEAGTPIFPEAPVPFHSFAMQYHPAHGIVVSGRSFTRLSEALDSHHPWVLSVYNDGKWRNATPSMKASDDIKKISGYQSNLSYVFPLIDATGLAIDPGNPDYAFAGSLISGWARANLTHPDETPLHAGNNLDGAKDIPGFIDAYPQDKAWKNQCNFITPGFDSEGRLWMLFRSANKMSDTDYALDLHYYTPEDLKKNIGAEGNTSKFTPTKTVEIKMPVKSTQWALCKPLTHPDNKNLIVIVSGKYEAPISIFNHNGTPDNPDDDTMLNLDALYDPTGASIPQDEIISLFEDPSNGEVWIASKSGAFMLRPLESGSNPHLAYRPGAMIPGRDNSLVRLQSVGVNAFAVDGNNRLWIGTDGEGIICLSPDRQEIEAEMGCANTPLPSDRIYGLCYNPESGSMLISTDSGIAEFISDNYSAGDGQAIRITPLTLTPDDGGTFRIHGLSPLRDIEIVTETGTSVARLKSDSEGNLEWSGRTENGERFGGGTYKLRYSGENEALGTMRILK